MGYLTLKETNQIADHFWIIQSDFVNDFLDAMVHEYKVVAETLDTDDIPSVISILQYSDDYRDELDELMSLNCGWLMHLDEPSRFPPPDSIEWQERGIRSIVEEEIYENWLGEHGFEFKYIGDIELGLRLLNLAYLDESNLVINNPIIEVW